jgi:hypothetical protein
MGTMLSWFRNEVGHLLDFIDQRLVVRRLFIGVVLWQFIDVYLFAKGIALRPGMNGMELAAIIGALTIPVTALSGLLFKMYGEGRDK